MKTTNEYIEIAAPAKVNLFLDVVDKRPDGYHNIESVIIRISLADELVIKVTDGNIETTVELMDITAIDKNAGLDIWKIPDNADNLTTRAGLLLKELSGTTKGAHIILRKRIPVAAGLGGGSADAASVLIGLNRLWRLGLSLEQLAEIGSRISYDVPALVYGGAMLMNGRGEKVIPLNSSAAITAGWRIVLVNPGFEILTKDIYSRYRKSLTFKQIQVKDMLFALESGKIEFASNALFNVLETTIFEKYPIVAIVAEALRESGALAALVSGTGATVFGLARNPTHAEIIIGRLSKMLDFPFWSRTVDILPDGVMVAHGPLEA